MVVQKLQEDVDDNMINNQEIIQILKIINNDYKGQIKSEVKKELTIEYGAHRSQRSRNPEPWEIDAANSDMKGIKIQQE